MLVSYVSFISVSNFLTTLFFSLSRIQKRYHHHHYYLHINDSKLCCKIEPSIEYMYKSAAHCVWNCLVHGSSNIFSWHLVVVNRHNYLCNLSSISQSPNLPQSGLAGLLACAHRTDLIKNVVLIKSNAVSQAKCQPRGKGGEGGVAPAVDRQTGSDKDTLQSKTKHLQGLLGLFWGCRGGQWGGWDVDDDIISCSLNANVAFCRTP